MRTSKRSLISDKSIEEILKQPYMDAKDLKTLMPSFGSDKCRDLIKDIRDEMKSKNYFVPKTKPLLALTKLVKKRLGI